MTGTIQTPVNVQQQTLVETSQDPPTGFDEGVLVEMARKGDRQAYGELVSRYRAGVVSVVYQMCGDLHLAEEAAQEAFLRAWLKLPKYRSDGSFRAWVFRIAMNAALDELRRVRPMVTLEDDRDESVDFSDLQETPGTAVEDRERAAAVRRAVKALPAGSRSALVLREYGGLSYAEIAAALDIPTGTVMSRLNSARTLLRQSLAGLLEEE